MVAETMLSVHGNPGSRTHAHGTSAKQALENSRRELANVAGVEPGEIVFTSGATESNNLAILGLATFGAKSGRMHVVTTAIEHKAVLEPCNALKELGFEITVVLPNQSGVVEPDSVLEAVRSDTLLVSVMSANNETGAIQPVSLIADGLQDSEVKLHVDAAQSFAKLIDGTEHERVDLFSISGHKIHGPTGIGALVVRKSRSTHRQLAPIIRGGGQEFGLRSGTPSVALTAGLAAAARIMKQVADDRWTACLLKKNKLLEALDGVPHTIVGDRDSTLSHCVSLTLHGIDAEAVFVAANQSFAISNGSACTSSGYSSSHVLAAQGMTEREIESTVRISWCADTPDLIFGELAKTLRALQ